MCAFKIHTIFVSFSIAGGMIGEKEAILYFVIVGKY